MKTIPLTRGEVAIVDDEDFESLSQYKWQCVVSRRSRYARRVTSRSNGKQEWIYMHRQIADLPDDQEVDHWNKDGLDNRRENLRSATRHQNSFNRKMSVSNTSGFRGVSFHKKSGKWQAGIGVDGKFKHLGLFLTELEAAKRWNEVALALWGEFASLNRI